MPPTTARPGLQLEFPQSLGVHDDYAAAQKAVDHLSDRGFPVQNCLIVGTDLKQVERITGRMTYPRAAGAGAASGAWFGLFIGLLLGLFNGEGQWLPTVVSALFIGLFFGLVWGVIGYSLTGGRRDFTSVSQVVATRYEVLVEHKLLSQAQEALADLPGHREQQFNNPTGL
ncbi:general stress protein [Solicola sp. PLA-1-18]|uniref:general stress protein n=1 Tax=Solicola sp. PLA-1-18 TaxID=3380532 RepID=UPI003B7D912C